MNSKLKLQVCAEPQPLYEFHCRHSLAILLAITFLGAVIRFLNLGNFGFEGDEVFTLQKVVGPITNERNWPLLFLLSKPIVWLLGVSEFSLRLLPAMLGVLSIPAFFYAGRKVYGELPMLLTGLFIALNHWHVYHSQTARFYSAVFLFSGLAILLLHTSLYTAKGWTSFLAGLCIIIGVGFHPTAIWPAIIFSIYCLTSIVVPSIRNSLPIRVIVGFYLPLIIVGIIAIGMAGDVLPTIRRFSEAKVSSWGYSGSHVILGWMRGLEIPVLILGACGLFSMYFKHRAIAYLTLLYALIPIGMLAAISGFMALRQDYVFSVTPVWFILAGSVAGTVLSSTSTPALARYGVILAIYLSFLPSTISHHTAKSTGDNRLAFMYLKQIANSHDTILHNFVTGIDYYTGLQSEHIKMNKEYFLKKFKDIESSGKTTWFVLISSRYGVGNEFLENWLAHNAFLEKRFDAKRFDYEVKSILIYKFVPNATKMFYSNQ